MPCSSSCSSPRCAIYPWWGSPHVWLRSGFFIARHFVWMMLTFLIARRFAREALRGTDASRIWGVFYPVLRPLADADRHRVVHVDREAVVQHALRGVRHGRGVPVGHLRVRAVVLFSWRDRADGATKLAFQKSIGGLMFGFATFWAYFLLLAVDRDLVREHPGGDGLPGPAHRLHTPYWLAARVIFGMVWMVPFAVLLSRKNKTRARVTSRARPVVLVGHHPDVLADDRPGGPVRMPAPGRRPWR